MVQAWTSCRVQANTHVLSVVQELATTASTAIWVHKKCSRLQLPTTNPDYRYAGYMGTACPIDDRLQVVPDKMEVVASFCYMGNMFSAGVGCELVVTTCVKSAWKKFRELLPVLTPCHLSNKTCGHVYSSCVQSAMLHASEKLVAIDQEQPDRAMNRQIMTEDVAMVRSSELLAKLELEDLDLILRERRLRWFGHVECSSGAVRTG